MLTLSKRGMLECMEHRSAFRTAEGACAARWGWQRGPTGFQVRAAFLYLGDGSENSNEQNNDTHQASVVTADSFLHLPHGTSLIRHRGQRLRKQDGADTHGSEGCIQGPVAKAVLQEEVEFLLDKPWNGGPAGEGREGEGPLMGEPNGSHFQGPALLE